MGKRWVQSKNEQPRPSKDQNFILSQTHQPQTTQIPPPHHHHGRFFFRGARGGEANHPKKINQRCWMAEIHCMVNFPLAPWSSAILKPSSWASGKEVGSLDGWKHVGKVMDFGGCKRVQSSKFRVPSWDEMMLVMPNCGQFLGLWYFSISSLAVFMIWLRIMPKGLTSPFLRANLLVGALCSNDSSK